MWRLEVGKNWAVVIATDCLAMGWQFPAHGVYEWMAAAFVVAVCV